MRARTTNLKQLILTRMATRTPFGVWTPVDFLDLGSRDAIDKTLQRLGNSGLVRRIDRGLYDKPETSRLTGLPTAPDYRAIIAAIGRRDQLRMLIDGLTAANDLGLTNAVPARVIIHTDARRRSIHLGNLTVVFKVTAPSRLYWADRPAMRVVQALHWLKDLLLSDHQRIMGRLRKVLAEPRHGPAIAEDLRQGLPTLPAWMQRAVRELFDDSNQKHRTPSRVRRQPHQDKEPRTPRSDRVAPNRVTRDRRTPARLPKRA